MSATVEPTARSGSQLPPVEPPTDATGGTGRRRTHETGFGEARPHWLAYLVLGVGLIVVTSPFIWMALSSLLRELSAIQLNGLVTTIRPTPRTRYASQCGRASPKPVSWVRRRPVPPVASVGGSTGGSWLPERAVGSTVALIVRSPASRRAPACADGAAAHARRADGTARARGARRRGRAHSSSRRRSRSCRSRTGCTCGRRPTACC